MKETIVIMIRKIVALTLMIVGFSCVGVAVHEAGHLIVNNALGGSGEIFYNYTLTAGHMDWITLPDHHIWLVYLAGVIIAAFILFLFFWLPARLTPSIQDVYVEGAVAGTVLANLFYAPTELVLYYYGQRLFEWAYIASYIVAAILFCLLYIKQLVKWVYWTRKNK